MAGHAEPILASRDLEATLRFYQALGFENRGAPPEEWDNVRGVASEAAAPARIDPPMDTEYGMREFTLFDPHDNEVRVGSPV